MAIDIDEMTLVSIFVECVLYGEEDLSRIDYILQSSLGSNRIFHIFVFTIVLRPVVEKEGQERASQEAHVNRLDCHVHPCHGGASMPRLLVFKVLLRGAFPYCAARHD